MPLGHVETRALGQALLAQAPATSQRVSASSLSWPPATISNVGALTLLPSYTPTGAIPTLPAQTLTGNGSATASVDAGDGWNNSGDTEGLNVNIASCSYLDPWVGPTAAPPSPLCS